MARPSQRVWWLVGLMVLPGCDALLNLGGGNVPDGGTGSPGLKRFDSQGAFEEYLKGQIEQRNGNYADFNAGGVDQTSGPDGSLAEGDAAASPEAPSAPRDDFSGTTTQESGVDEADVVKTDGTHIYMIDSVGDASVLRIVRANPATELGVVSETALEGYGRDLYLRDNKIVAITSGGGFYFYALKESVAAQDVDAIADETISILPPFGGEDFVYQRPHTVVTVLDISDPASPSVLSTTSFDGTQSATRMIDGVLHMVIANYQEYYFDVMPMLGRPELDVQSVDAVSLIPTYTRVNADATESAGAVVSWEDLYYPEDADGFGVVTLVSLDADNDAQFTAVGVVAEPGLIYSSLSSLYMTNTQYDWLLNARTTTNLYKFDYEERGARPVASGSVPGRILNQYSMGEYQGNLRVATTVDAQFTCGFFRCTQTAEASNGVYVLGQTADAWSVLGGVENIAPRETIQSARFMGDKGYVVTFEQTDPLFTLDLSDPAAPRVVGQLEVPGFSTFLTPMDESHLLAVGQYVPPPGSSGTWGVQVSIFDVSDFANPVRTSNVVIGDDVGAYSEAVSDPKAFTYFAEQNLVALPISIAPTYDYSGSGGVTDGGSTGGSEGSTGVVDGDVAVSDPMPPIGIEESPYVEPVLIDPGFDGLLVYRVTAESGLTELGRISTRFDETSYWGTAFTRGVFIGDKVYAVSNLGTRESAVSDVSTPENELFYGPVYEEVEPPIVIEPAVPVDDEAVMMGSGSSEGGSGSAVAVAGHAKP